MPWRPAKTATSDQTERAVLLLRSGEWADGKVWSDPNDPKVQYRAARHPNYGKPGTHPGVEVWLDVDIPEGETTIVRVTPHDARARVLDEFARRGWPRDEADAMVAIESGWDAKARNKQGFGGLIGFSPALQRRWGVYPIWEKCPTVESQVEYVGRYLDEEVRKPWRVPGDTYLTGAAPSYIGAPDWQIIYKRGGKAWEQNPGWRGSDGEITAGSIRGVLLRKMARMKASGGKSPPPAGGEPSASPKGEEPVPPLAPSCSSSDSVPPTSSRARAGAAVASAVGAISGALGAATNNPWLLGGLVLAVLVLCALLALWLYRRK